jgi:signal transduction histidine kinase
MATFKARARALDLLGRQQIAGIPTAINELFKNAHDAYADNVEIDYFRKEKLLVLRDNGLGMTKDDFESRWLTLGTESKFSNRKIPPPPIDPDKPKRPILGEKGIGRLAIASIGSQILILTKAKRKGEHHEIVAALINWSIFELPGLDLDDIEIPIREFSMIPSSAEINEMKDELKQSLNALRDKDDITYQEFKTLYNKIDEFNVNPREINNKLIGKFDFADNNGGTHFYISPVEETLNHDIDGNKDRSVATKIEKMLMGFSNTMVPNYPEPLIEIAFRDYKSTDGTYTDLLDKEQFFTPEDFELADHHFIGEFDEFGQFNGTVTIYGEKNYNHKVNWNGNFFKKTDCGPFSINLAYVQGVLRQSIIDSENHGRIIAKADKFGGLYIYRDNVRILPYGNNDYDFIDIEKNRTKSASYYFFSYRRMFGVIYISRSKNYELKEKAGREGFIENKAYRQLQDILKNFFLQLAADFFREASSNPQSEFWKTKRTEREAYYKALERRDKQAKVRKEKFSEALNEFFEKLSSNFYQNEIDALLAEIQNEFESLAYIENPEEAGQALLNCEIDARIRINDFKQRTRISSPKGFSVSKDTRRDFDAYMEEFNKLEYGIFQDALEAIDDKVEDFKERLNIEISKRKRLEQSVEYISNEAKKAASGKQKEAKEAVSEITLKVKELTNELMIDLDNQIRTVKDRFKTLSLDSTEDFDLVEQRKLMESDINKGRERVTGTLERVIKQLQAIYWEKDLSDTEIITSDQIADAMGEELEEMRNRIHADIELSQLGLAVGIIHHEFSSTIKSIRSSLRDLKAWADVNENLEGLYKNIKISFEHLDGYLNLFTPLNRRLYRIREEIPVIEIKTFLIDLFKPRLERHNIQFKHTKGFACRKIYGFRSTFYPVFVNVIDNAIYWLTQKDTPDRTIRLHADETGFYISNNGPEILHQDKEKIFDLGFTRKMDGRGMGLHISREVLNAEGYNIYIDTPREKSTVTFKIEKFKPNEQ